MKIPHTATNNPHPHQTSPISPTTHMYIHHNHCHISPCFTHPPTSPQRWLLINGHIPTHPYIYIQPICRQIPHCHRHSTTILTSHWLHKSIIQWRKQLHCEACNVKHSIGASGKGSPNQGLPQKTQGTHVMHKAWMGWCSGAPSQGVWSNWSLRQRNSWGGVQSQVVCCNNSDIKAFQTS